MTRKLIDITVGLRPDLLDWPGSQGYSCEVVSDEGGVIDSILTFDPHLGTHVDAPLHHVLGGADTSGLALGPFLGDAYVLDCGDAEVVDEQLLIRKLSHDVPERLLSRTRNGGFYPDSTSFRSDFTALDERAARCLVASGVKLVGIDYLSIQRLDSSNEVRGLLLRAGVAILECLDLRGAADGWYELIVLPLLAHGAEAAPASTILRERL